jgi:hypothetical protein
MCLAVGVHASNEAASLVVPEHSVAFAFDIRGVVFEEIRLEGRAVHYSQGYAPEGY